MTLFHTTAEPYDDEVAMLQGALPPLRISTVLNLLLLTDLVSPFHIVEYSLGSAVTINAGEICNISVSRDGFSLITWRKQNNSHILLFAAADNSEFSNFSESRFSFQDPLTLRITDAQPGDSGNYTFHISSSNRGKCDKTFSLRVSCENGTGCQPLNSSLIYGSSSAAVLAILIIIIIAIVYWKMRPKSDKPPDKIHQTTPENAQKEEPIYDNADQDYYHRFNTLYDRLGVTAEGTV